MSKVKSIQARFHRMDVSGMYDDDTRPIIFNVNCIVALIPNDNDTVDVLTSAGVVYRVEDIRGSFQYAFINGLKEA